MASVGPSEEERRLLREYRLIALPPRRPSCSPATSNASSSTTATINNLIEYQLLTNLTLASVTTDAKLSTPNSVLSIELDSSSKQTNKPTELSPKEPGEAQLSAESLATNHKDKRDRYRKDTSKGLRFNQRRQNRLNDNHNGSGNQKIIPKHMADSPNRTELSADETGKMMELASGFSYLNLVSVNSGNLTKLGAETNHADRSIKEGSNRQHGLMLKSTNLESTKSVIQRGTPNYATLANSYRSNIMSLDPQDRKISSILGESCKPYIFEKVDYIKKISSRKKAFKKLKRARKKLAQSTSSPPGKTEPESFKVT